MNLFNPVEWVAQDVARVSRRAIGCLCCIIVVGLILIIIGISLLSAAVVDNRSKLVNQYNSAATQWVGTYRNQFQGAAPVSLDGNTMALDTSVDPLNDHKSTFVSYQPLKYTGNIAASNNVMTVSFNGMPVSNYSVQLQGSYIALTRHITLSQATLNCAETQQDACSTSTVSRTSTRVSCKPICSAECSNRQGTWNTTTKSCEIVRYLSSACFVADLEGNEWRFSTNSDSTYKGCYYKSYDSDLSIGSYMPGIYGSLQVDPIPVVIRSLMDPYVLADHLTSGSYYFGATAGENARAGTVLLIIGIIMIALVVCSFIAIVKMASSMFNGSKPYFNLHPFFLNQNNGQPFGGINPPIQNSVPYNNQQQYPPQQYPGQNPGYNQPPPQQQYGYPEPQAPPQQQPYYPPQQNYPPQQYPPQQYSPEQQQYPPQQYPPQQYPPQQYAPPNQPPQYY